MARIRGLNVLCAWTLFDWDGYERTIPLFNREETPVNVGKLMKRLAAPQNVSIASLD